jgi:hypothetical protein
MSDLTKNDFIINRWKRVSSGLSKVPYIVSSNQDTQKVVTQKVIGRFTPYYARYVSNMRTPAPSLELLSEKEYQIKWIQEATQTIEKSLLKDNPELSDLAEIALVLYEDYGRFECETPSEAVDIEYGTRKQRWVQEVEKLLYTKKDSKEYQSIGDTLGETDNERALYLWERFKDDTPSSAIVEYFGIVKKIIDSKLTKGVVLTLVVPLVLKNKTGTTRIDVVSSGDYVTYKEGSLKIQYSDETNEIFAVLESWYLISKNKQLPLEVYAGSCSVIGFNNVTHLQETRVLHNVYPHGVSKNLLELKYTESK